MRANGPTERAFVVEMLKTDVDEALRRARAIQPGWYRCQSLTYVAEQIGDWSTKDRVLGEAFDAADSEVSANRICTVASWPLRLLARINPKDAERRLRRLLDVAATESHAVRRMDALMALWGSVSETSGPMSEIAFASTLEATLVAHGWKRDHALGTLAAVLIRRGEVARGWDLAARCEIPKEARRVRRRLEEEFGPKPD